MVRVLETEEDLSLKYLINVLDERPVGLTQLQWNWMSGSTHSARGPMNAALPPGLKLSSQSILVRDPEVLPDEEISDSLFLL